MRGKCLDDLIQEVFLRHARDLLVKGEPFHDGPHIGRKCVDIAVEIRRQLVWIVQQPAQIEL